MERYGTKHQLMVDLCIHKERGAELGVMLGDSASWYLKELRPRELYLIEPWRHQDPSEYASWANADDQAQEGRYRSVLARFGKSTGVRVMRQQAHVVARYLEPEMFDWVVHDANHKADAVVRDLSAWAALLKIGGIFIVDDVCTRSDLNPAYYSVPAGIDRFLKMHSGFTAVARSQEDYPSVALKRMS